MRQRVTIFAISCSVLLLELVQTRIFSVVFWNHFVYFIISVALLGFGVSGTWLSIVRKSHPDGLISIPTAASLFSLSTLISSLLIPQLRTEGLNLNQGLLPVFQLLFAYLFAIVPYFFAGWILGSLFRDSAERISGLYFWDLLGAGTGCLLFLALIQPIGAINMVLTIAAIGLGTSVLGMTSGQRFSKVAPAMAAALLVVCTLTSHKISAGIQPIGQKGYQRNYNGLAPGDEKVVEFSEWNAISRIDVVSTKLHPDAKSIFIDGDAWTGMEVKPSLRKGPFRTDQESMTDNRLPYLIRPDPRTVLVLGSGGGFDVFNAIRAGATRIDAVEINPTISRLGQVEYRAVNDDLFGWPGVFLWNEEGRSFVRRTEQKYDVIMIHGIDTFAAINSGAYVLSENYLYTVEAIKDYLSRLGPNGILAIDRWYHIGESARLFATVTEALYQLKFAEPEKHVVVAEGSTSAILVGVSPFTSAETAKISAHYAARKGALFFPAIHPLPNEPLQRAMVDYSRLRNENREESLFEIFPYDIRPVSDDSPFFFNYEKWGRIFHALWSDGDWSPIRGHWPTLTLCSLLLLSCVSIGAFMLIPLRNVRAETARTFPGKIWNLYFCAIGISFIFAEIALMQRFTLLLGHPVRSMALILGSLLVSSGLGSRFGTQNKLAPEVKLLLLGVALLFVTYAYPPISNLAMGQPLMVRGTVAVMMVFPIGFLMGIPFPTGILAVSRYEKDYVPWLWGVNGGATVCGSVLAIILAIGLGFSMVLLCASVGYLCAALAYRNAVGKPV